jgi:tyrosyl-tRNA synthetase
VRNRLEDGTGMSYAEFSYPLLQAWDWWELFRKGCQIQIGGADQFGNILAGVEIIKTMKKTEPVQFESDPAFQGHVANSFVPSPREASEDGGNINEPIGFTVPLLTTSTGVKFGKSEGNAIWLDKEMTSTFDLYQFFLRTADADVEKYLKLFTFIPIADIKSIMDEHVLDESKRTAQHKLAFDFVELVHGLTAAQDAERQHRMLFDKHVSIGSLRAEASAATIAPEPEKEEARRPGDWNISLNKYVKPVTKDNAPSVHLKLPRSLVVGQTLNKVLWSAGLVSSRGEGQRLIAARGCHIGSKTGRGAATNAMEDYLSFTQVTNVKATDTEEYIIDGDLLILRIGKWKIKIVKIVSDEEYEKSGLSCPGWKETEGDETKEEWKAEVQEIIAFRTGKNQKRLAKER